MKESMRISLVEIGGLLVLMVILFKNLQPFEKAIAIVCLGYFALVLRLQFFRVVFFMAKMLTKACISILEYQFALFLNLYNNK